MFGFFKKKPSPGLTIQHVEFDSGTDTQATTNLLAMIALQPNESHRRQTFALYLQNLLRQNRIPEAKYVVRYLVDNRMLARNGKYISLAELFKNQNIPAAFFLDMVELVDDASHGKVLVLPYRAS
ncbi:MAG: hypothetical protein MUC97_01970 [Bernardetiaceae bacterium]|jgi:hypothetical protein|nr:hypothetical protein [Bernardetiaceae bacterium]